MGGLGLPERSGYDEGRLDYDPARKSRLTTKEHLSKHDREIAEIWELMGKLAKGALAAQDELREIRAEIREDRRKAWAAIRETQAAIRELSAAQKRTETSLRAFIDSLRRAGDGHTRRKMDLQ
jgi:DNA-binding transcriptional MerR regulator